MTILMHEVCPFRIGSRVKVAPTNQYSGEWTGNYAVVMIEWRYQEGVGHGINIGIASDDEIKHRHGYTDGWKVDDLMPAESVSSSVTKEPTK